MHELMHAAGFWHEQARSDRDKHIQVFWKNIIQGKEFNFNKFQPHQINDLKAEYDQCSIMHYGAYAFSNGNGPTIQAIRGAACF